jgi:hypothetical protein
MLQFLLEKAKNKAKFFNKQSQALSIAHMNLVNFKELATSANNFGNNQSMLQKHDLKHDLLGFLEFAIPFSCTAISLHEGIVNRKLISEFPLDAHSLEFADFIIKDIIQQSDITNQI